MSWGGAKPPYFTYHKDTTIRMNKHIIANDGQTQLVVVKSSQGVQIQLNSEFGGDEFIDLGPDEVEKLIQSLRP